MISFQELASDEQLMPEARVHHRHLNNAKDSYRLIVVNEAHALRNEDTSWYRAMERLLGGTRKQVVLFTATPINNGLWDLYNLVMLFARHDRAFTGSWDRLRQESLHRGGRQQPRSGESRPGRAVSAG